MSSQDNACVDKSRPNWKGGGLQNNGRPSQILTPHQNSMMRQRSSEQCVPASPATKRSVSACLRSDVCTSDPPAAAAAMAGEGSPDEKGDSSLPCVSLTPPLDTALHTRHPSTHLSPRLETPESSLARGASVSSQAACLNTLPCVMGASRGQEIIQRILEAGSLVLLHAELGQASALLTPPNRLCFLFFVFCFLFLSASLL
jgi:hypothetical protein